MVFPLLVLTAYFSSLLIVNQCLDVWVCSGNVCDAGCCCYFSYHGLINVRYENRTAKTVAAKRLVKKCFSEGGRMAVRCQCLPQRTMAMGTPQAPL